MEKKSSVIEDRKKKAEKLQALGVQLYPTGFKQNITAVEVNQRFGDMDSAAYAPLIRSAAVMAYMDYFAAITHVGPTVLISIFSLT